MELRLERNGQRYVPLGPSPFDTTKKVTPPPSRSQPLRTPKYGRHDGDRARRYRRRDSIPVIPPPAPPPPPPEARPPSPPPPPAPRRRRRAAARPPPEEDEIIEEAERRRLLDLPNPPIREPSPPRAMTPPPLALPPPPPPPRDQHHEDELQNAYEEIRRLQELHRATQNTLAHAAQQERTLQGLLNNTEATNAELKAQSEANMHNFLARVRVLEATLRTQDTRLTTLTEEYQTQMNLAERFRANSEGLAQELETLQRAAETDRARLNEEQVLQQTEIINLNDELRNARTALQATNERLNEVNRDRRELEQAQEREIAAAQARHEAALAALRENNTNTNQAAIIDTEQQLTALRAEHARALAELERTADIEDQANAQRDEITHLATQLVDLRAQAARRDEEFTALQNRIVNNQRMLADADMAQERQQNLLDQTNQQLLETQNNVAHLHEEVAATLTRAEQLERVIDEGHNTRDALERELAATRLRLAQLRENGEEPHQPQQPTIKQELLSPPTPPLQGPPSPPPVAVELPSPTATPPILPPTVLPLPPQPTPVRKKRPAPSMPPQTSPPPPPSMPHTSIEINPNGSVHLSVPQQQPTPDLGFRALNEDEEEGEIADTGNAKRLRLEHPRGLTVPELTTSEGRREYRQAVKDSRLDMTRAQEVIKELRRQTPKGLLAIKSRLSKRVKNNSSMTTKEKIQYHWIMTNYQKVLAANRTANTAIKNYNISSTIGSLMDKAPDDLISQLALNELTTNEDLSSEEDEMDNETTLQPHEVEFILEHPQQEYMSDDNDGVDDEEEFEDEEPVEEAAIDRGTEPGSST